LQNAFPSRDVVVARLAFVNDTLALFADQQLRRDGGVAPGIRECIEGYTAIIEVAESLPILVVTKLDVLNNTVQFGISVFGKKSNYADL
jgi:hypothetical protein